MSDTDLLLQIASDVGELKGTMRGLVKQTDAQDDRMEAQDKRIGSLERSRSWASGVSATVSAIVSVAFAFITTR